MPSIPTLIGGRWLKHDFASNDDLIQFHDIRIIYSWEAIN